MRVQCMDTTPRHHVDLLQELIEHKVSKITSVYAVNYVQLVESSTDIGHRSLNLVLEYPLFCTFECFLSSNIPTSTQEVLLTLKCAGHVYSRTRIGNL